MSRRNQTRGRKQNKRRNHTSGSRRIVCMVVVAVLLVLGQGMFTSYVKNQAYIEQEIELMSRLEEEQQRTEEIAALRIYSETDEYVEEVAREKLGMSYEDEVIFQAMQ